MKLQVKHYYYFDKHYDTKERFISYWYQVDEIVRLEPNSVLEIGIGNGFISKYLKERGVNIATLDLDVKLNPNIVGSVLDIPIQDNSFDIVACYEVLEHLPFDKFPKALLEILRVSKLYSIISLPDASRAYRFLLQIPRIGEIKRLLSLPKLEKMIHVFDGEHYWEIGKAGYPLTRIINEIQRAGFRIERTFRVFEFPYHRFFTLNKDEKR